MGTCWLYEYSFKTFDYKAMKKEDIPTEWANESAGDYANGEEFL